MSFSAHWAAVSGALLYTSINEWEGVWHYPYVAGHAAVWGPVEKVLDPWQDSNSVVLEVYKAVLKLLQFN